MDLLDILTRATSNEDTATISQAKNKIIAEMELNPDNPYIQAVGEYLVQHLDIEPSLADNILDKDKTLINSYEVMKKQAEKKVVRDKGSKSAMVMFTPQEGFGIIIKYFKGELKLDKKKADNKPDKEETKTDNDEE